MVLQKEPAGAVIWGYGISGATVTVTLCQDQEIIMKKVTHVKGKATHPLFSFCLLLPPAGLSQNECLCSSSGYSSIHPSIHKNYLTIYYVLGTEDAKETKTVSKYLSSRSSWNNGNRH